MAEKNDDEKFEDVTKDFNKPNEGLVNAPDTIWAATEMFWPTIHGRGIPVKGVFLVELVDEDGKDFYFASSSDATDWDIKGMLQHAQDMLADEARLHATYHIVNQVINGDEDDDDEEE